ncbi:MAG: hypothetical protein ACC628_22870 [Pirellulaceae bacterium]
MKIVIDTETDLETPLDVESGGVGIDAWLAPRSGSYLTEPAFFPLPKR